MMHTTSLTLNCYKSDIVIIDNLSFEEHVNFITKTAFFHLKISFSHIKT